ncbi:right-handed parallel beta-helix repeat-containing protein [Candidatus Bathyarchaeota archaeon]|nr:right-handed parallel beta-helix repeat-containing protein [Candidatus Bathyarchaeota archaeon]
MKRTLSVFMFVLLIVSTLSLAIRIQPVRAEPRTWTVKGDGGADFATIGEAIFAAKSGDTIFVYNGTYYEHPLIYSKGNLTLVGENKYGTIIDGSGLGSIIKISYANSETICNFTIRNGGLERLDCAVSLGPADHCDISNNIIANTSFGVLDGWDSCDGNRIVGNQISNCTNGIYFNSPYNVQVVGNTISNMVDINGECIYGIHFESPEGSNNTIIGNTVIGYCGYGIAVRYADRNLITGNVVTDSFYGIELSLGSCNNNVTGNILIGNGVGIRVVGDNNSISKNEFSNSVPVDSYISDIGIWIESSLENTICDNEVTDNGCGLLLVSSNNTKVYHNNFVDNGAQAFVSDSFGTMWDNGYPSGGNFWSDYLGVDANDDAIGDTPYVIDSSNVDNYPFISYGCTHRCDINGDGKVDIADVAAVGRAFGSYPDHEKWDPLCDLNGDSRVDVRDVALVCRKFGWHKP